MSRRIVRLRELDPRRVIALEAAARSAPERDARRAVQAWRTVWPPAVGDPNAALDAIAWARGEEAARAAPRSARVDCPDDRGPRADDLQRDGPYSEARSRLGSTVSGVAILHAGRVIRAFRPLLTH